MLIGDELGRISVWSGPDHFLHVRVRRVAHRLVLRFARFPAQALIRIGMVVRHVRERAMLFADLAESSSVIAVPCLRRSNDRAIVEILFSGRRRNRGAVAGSIARDFDSSGTLLLDAALTLDTNRPPDTPRARRPP